MIKMNTNYNSPNFSNPPLAEVACGVSFDPLLNIKSTVFGSFWNIIKEDFPEIEEQTPIPIQSQFPNFIISNLPQLRRLWFINQEYNKLIQVQQDRFLFNWKKSDNENDTYPRFHKIYSKFEDYLRKYKEHLKSTYEIKLDYHSFNLAYINKIDVNANEINSVFKEEILLNQEINSLTQISSQISKEFFSKKEGIGDFRIIINLKINLTKENENMRTIRLEILVDSIKKEEDILQEWFDQAHIEINNIFLAITSEKMQEKWGLQRK